MVEGLPVTDLFPGASSIDDPGEFQHIARSAPAPMTAGSVLWIRADLGGFGHQ